MTCTSTTRACSSTRRRPVPRPSTPTAWSRCPGSSTCTPTCASPAREDAETILTGSQAAALGGYTAVLAMANTSPVTDTAEAATRVWELGREAGLVHVQPVGAVTRGLGGEELAELGPDAPLARRGHGLLRRRQVRPRRPRHAPGAGVRQGLRRRRLPALAGPVAGRPVRLLPRGRAVRPARPARLAGHRRGGHRRPRRDARAPHRLAGPRRPRLHRRLRRGGPLGEGPGASTSPPRSPRTTCC